MKMRILALLVFFIFALNFGFAIVQVSTPIIKKSSGAVVTGVTTPIIPNSGLTCPVGQTPVADTTGTEKCVTTEGKSVVFYVKELNAKIVGSNSGSSSSKVPDKDGTLDGTTTVKPKPVVVTNGIVSSSSNVIVKEEVIGGSKYYTATYKAGFNKDSDNFCLDFSDKFIPVYQVYHGKYCFFIKKWGIDGSKIENVYVLLTRTPVSAGDDRVEVDCSYSAGFFGARIDALAALLQPNESETHNCDLQNNYAGNNIYDGITLNFPVGIIQQQNGDFSFSVSIALLGGNKYPA
jgi:hypothetical protein